MRYGSFTAFLLVLSATLHTQHISHGLGGFFLCRGGDMGIGVQGEACREVTQHAGQRLDIYSVLQRHSEILLHRFSPFRRTTYTRTAGFCLRDKSDF